jgi:hypothetical protein
MKLNAKALGLVAGVAASAVVVTTALVARQVPKLNATDEPAAPIQNSSPSATPSVPASPTPPTSAPSTTPSAGKTPTTKPTPPRRPVTQTLDPGSLGRGTAPQIPYVDEHTLIGGNRKASSKSPIVAGARAGDGLMAVVAITDARTELQIFDRAGRVTERVPDVSRVRSSAGGSYSAYSTENFDLNSGGVLKGSTVSWRDNRSGETIGLSRPDDYGIRILGVDSERVYFSSRASATTSTSSLYEWWIGNGKVSRLSHVRNPTALSANGSQVASLVSLTDTGSCTSVLASFDGSRYWKTCDYQVDAFAPAGRTVLAGPAYRDGYADGYVAVLDNSNGELLRKWQGVSVMNAAYEDDDHILLVAEKGSRGAIVRCSISTGGCELATAYVEGAGDQAVGNPYKLG